MQVYLGIDWSRYKHDAIFMNQEGVAIANLTIEHRPEGFLKLDNARSQLGIIPMECFVGVETAHNLLIDFFWDRGYNQVYVVPPQSVKSNRGRYRQSGARSDPSDAFVVADMLRTDRGRLHPWFPDSPLTRQIRAKISLTMHLTTNINRFSNRLRDVLWRYYPAGLEAFSDLTSNIALAFLQSYPTPQEAAQLSFEAFQTFARKHRYPNPKKLPRCFARLQALKPEPSEDIVLAYCNETLLLARFLQELVQAKKKALGEVQELFYQHPDHLLFLSLPGTGDFLAPALLAKFGDDRRRFPSPSSLQALAGSCPVTKSSGKWKAVHFRYACDREFRYIAQQWAKSSLKSSIWANAYLERVLPHCNSISHAYRCLANRWIAIGWKVWQSGQPYDEAYHLRQVALRGKNHL